MGRGRYAASKTGKKSRRNEGLTTVPAMFGRDNPAQPPAVRHLAQPETAPRKGEILRQPRLSAVRRLAKPPAGPGQTGVARRIVPPADGLHGPPEQAHLQITVQAGKTVPVDRHGSPLIELGLIE